MANNREKLLICGRSFLEGIQSAPQRQHPP